MKTASVRDLRHRFGSLLTWINEGKEIQITMRRRVIARLVAEKCAASGNTKMPDFAARLKKIHGEKVLPVDLAAAILADNKGRY